MAIAALRRCLGTTKRRAESSRPTTRARPPLAQRRFVRRLRPDYPNLVWSDDFVEDRTHDGWKYRMLNVIDEFTRECIAIRVNRKLKAIDVIDVLSDMFILRGIPSHIRSDNVLCREAALDFGQQVSLRRQGANVGSKLIQMVSTVNGIAPSHSKHRIQRH